MNELAIHGDKHMTVREVAEVLGCDPEAIKWHIRELYPDLMRNGVTTYLTEEQVTAIKQKMIPTSQLVGAITDLEAAEMLLKSAEHFKVRFEQEQAARIEAENKLAVAEPKAAFTDLAIQSRDVLSMNDAAKILKLGFGNKTLYKKLREQGVLMADNVPYQKYIACGYFRVDESPILIGDYIQIKRVTKVTQKGMMWLSRMLEQQGATA
jgi:phage antirepressor YoqD-like protein